MDNFLITGGCGFIGSHLVNKLLKNKCKIFVIDLDKKIASNQIKNKKIEYIEGDVSNYKNFLKIKNVKIKYAFHFAAQTSGRVSMENPNLDIRTNIKGAFNFCKWANDYSPEVSVFSSSMAVYGNAGEKINENNATNPSSIYGISKLAGEGFFNLLRSSKNKVKIVRLFNVYGPNQDFLNLKQGMLSIYLYQAYKYGKIEITGNTKRFRDFIYIDDVIKSILAIIKSEYDLVNIGSGKKTTVEQLINIISRVMNRDIKIKELPGHSGDVFGTHSSNKIMKKLKLHPSISLKDGIHKTFINLKASKL